MTDRGFTARIYLHVHVTYNTCTCGWYRMYYMWLVSYVLHTCSTCMFFIDCINCYLNATVMV